LSAVNGLVSTASNCFIRHISIVRCEAGMFRLGFSIIIILRRTFKRAAE